MTNILRSMGHGIMCIAGTMYNAAFEIMNNMLNIFGLLQSNQFLTFYNSLRPILLAALAVSLVIIGFMLMLQRIKDKMQVVTNVMLAILLVIGMPTLMVEAGNITETAAKAVSSETHLPLLP